MDSVRTIVSEQRSEGLFESNIPLDEKLDKARIQLLDLSARNRLLNMPRGSRGRRSLDIIEGSTGEIFRHLVQEGKSFTFAPAREDSVEQAANAQSNEALQLEEVGQHAQPSDNAHAKGEASRRHTLQTRLTSPGLQKRLLDLYLGARTLEEEQGVNVLYLTLGALKWADPNDAKKVRWAPLLLVPVQLERATAGDRFRLVARQDDFASNLSLETFLDRTHTLRMPEFEADDTFDPVAYIDAVRVCIKTKPEWAILPDHISLGFFSFSKFLMYRDLDPANWPKESSIERHALIRQLLSDGFPSVDDMADDNANIDELVSPAEMVQVLDSDSSQTLAIHDARRGKNLVIQGPPGTGKSQTIANIIAAAIKDGKTVLFVAEKMAALEVVKRRLDEAGVGDACLELHSNKTNKRAVLEELRRTWELGPPRQEDPLRLFARLTEVRDVLNAHGQRIHEIDQCSELTPYQVQGHLTRLRAAGEKPNDIELTDPETWGRQGYLSRHDLLVDLAGRVQSIGKPDDHAWVGVGLDAITPMDHERLVVRVRALAKYLAEALPQFEKAAVLLEVAPPTRFADAPRVVSLLRRIAGAPALTARAMGSDAWKSVDSIDALLQEGRRLKELRADLASRATEEAWDGDLSEVEQLLGELPATFDREKFSHLQQATSLLPRLIEAALKLGRALGREPGVSLADLENLLRIGERVAVAPPASPESFASDLWEQGIEKAGELADTVAALENLRAELADKVTDAAWSTDLRQARSLLAGRGRSIFRFFSGQWRDANRLVRSVLTLPDQPLPSTLDLLDKLSRAKTTKERIKTEYAFGRSAFGKDWRGERSNSGPLLALVEWMRSLKGLGAEPRLIASRNPKKDEIAACVQELSELQRAASTLLGGLWDDLAVARDRHLGGALSASKVSLDTLLRLGLGYEQAIEMVQGMSTTSLDTVGDSQMLVKDLIAGQESLSAIHAGRLLAQAAFDRAWEAEESDWDELLVTSQWMRANADIRALAGRVGERERLTPMAEFIDAARLHVRSTIQSLASELSLDVHASFGDVPEAALIDNISQRLHRWIDENEKIFEWTNYRDRASRATEQGCGGLVLRMADGRLRSDEVVSAFEMAYFEATYERIVAKSTELAHFDGRTHGRLVRRFVELDEERINVARVEVVRAHHAGVPHRDGAIGPLGILRNEIQKKRGHMPLRKLVAKAGPALRALKPVFMMSPLSVAQFLPPGAMDFDMLIMDEASQIEPVDALGAIARVKQVVVVGDQKQLPPTTFFNKMIAVDDDDDEDATSLSYVESVLGLFSARGLPSRMLRWHYRSRHHSLIAVSNQQFYENKLFIVPSPYTAEAGMGLHFHYIPHGLFDSGGKRDNLVEAKAVAEAVVEHARRRPGLSLGVATFSAAQSRAIYDELEILRRTLDLDVEAFFNEHRNEPFFVKNLENVQGDERDVMFISVGYGRSEPGGRVPMFFGPLGRDGGERRLNVLISRAKRSCQVFASMTDEDIDPKFAAGRPGVAALRIFLRYARTGTISLSETTGRDYESIFEEQVAEAIRTQGYDVQTQVGTAGFFIDLGVVDPARPGRFLLGIECDGAGYHSARSARERDRLRQMVLEDHGWTIRRIWSTDWFQRPAEQLERVISAIKRRKRELDKDGSDISVVPPAEPEDAFVAREEQVGDDEIESGFAPYEEAKLGFPRGGNRDLANTPRPVLAALVIEALRQEGPMNVNIVTTRIREAWGLKRSGSRIEAAVYAAIRLVLSSGEVVHADDFLWLPGTSPTPRDRKNVEAVALRRADMLPPTEIEAAAIDLLNKNFGATTSQIVQAVARGFGIRNTSAQVWAAIEGVIKKTIQEGRLIEQDGLLRVAGG